VYLLFGIFIGGFLRLTIKPEGATVQEYQGSGTPPLVGTVVDCHWR
jgi:uncharacterized membrane protein YraQ (UPF0718 family)